MANSMHEFILFSQIPAARHEQILHILAGVASHRPTEFCEQHLIYRQLRLPDATGFKKMAAKQSVQAQQLAHHRLFRAIDYARDGCPEAFSWKFRTESVPEPGNKLFVSRSVVERITSSSELERFRGASEWYRYVNQFVIRGRFFVLNNIIIRVYRVIIPPEGTGSLEPLDAPLPRLSECEPLDSSGMLVVDAFVRVEEGANARLAEQAMSELTVLQRMLGGAIELRMPDRLALDTRVKGV